MKEDRPLTPREIEVIKLITEGLSNLEIGEKLYISKATVKSNLENIYQKLDIHNRVILALWAKDNNLI